MAGARVWRARHDPSGLPVWVTVHGGRSARKPAVRDALLSAWQRIVGIDHPGVVPPLAMGVTPDAPTLAARGLPAGAPWVAAPVPRGGTLRDLAPIIVIVVRSSTRSNTTADASGWSASRILRKASGSRTHPAVARASATPFASGVITVTCRPVVMPRPVPGSITWL